MPFLYLPYIIRMMHGVIFCAPKENVKRPSKMHLKSSNMQEIRIPCKKIVVPLLANCPIQHQPFRGVTTLPILWAINPITIFIKVHYNFLSITPMVQVQVQKTCALLESRPVTLSQHLPLTTSISLAWNYSGTQLFIYLSAHYSFWDHIFYQWKSIYNSSYYQDSVHLERCTTTHAPH